MSKENNLSVFLKDIADSLRESNNPLTFYNSLPAQNFSDYIKYGQVLDTTMKKGSYYPYYFLMFNNISSYITSGSSLCCFELVSNSKKYLLIILFVVPEERHFEGFAFLLDENRHLVSSTSEIGSSDNFMNMGILPSGSDTEVCIGFPNDMEDLLSSANTNVDFKILRTF